MNNLASEGPAAPPQETIFTAQQDPPKGLRGTQEEQLLPLLSLYSLYLSLVSLSTILFNACADGLCITVPYYSPGTTSIL